MGQHLAEDGDGDERGGLRRVEVLQNSKQAQKFLAKGNFLNLIFPTTLECSVAPKCACIFYKYLSETQSGPKTSAITGQKAWAKSF